MWMLARTAHPLLFVVCDSNELKLNGDVESELPLEVV